MTPLITLLGLAGTLILTAQPPPQPVPIGPKPAIPQPVPAGPKLRPPSANVRDHGARGNGLADDSSAIQSAIEARNGNIYFPPGTYRLARTVVIDLANVGPIMIRGDGGARILMVGDGPAFKFLGSHQGTADPGTVRDSVWSAERMPLMEHLEIIGAGNDADGIEASGTMQLTLHHLLVRKCRHAIRFTGRNRNVIVSSCHLYQNRGVGVYFDAVNLHQVNVSGCQISYNDGGGVVCRGGEVRNLQITGCDIESNQGKNRPATANVLIDSSGGSNAEVAITGNTIQHNHNAAGSANIRIKGPSANTVKSTDELRDGHISITGNVVSDVKVNVQLENARGVVITGNTFWTAYEWNLLAEKSSHITVGPNNFDRNPRYAGEEKPDTTNALAFRDCSDCNLSGFTITGTRAAPAALTLERCNRFNVTGLSILDCDGVGMALKDVRNSRVSGCLIRDDRAGTTSVALRVEGGRANMIVQNYLGRPGDLQNAAPGLLRDNYTGEP
jgi:hypothetical protein